MKPRDEPSRMGLASRICCSIHECWPETAARYCKWRLVYSSIAEGTENVDATGVTVDTADILVPTTAYRLTETTITMVAANLAIEDVIGCTISRIASTGTAVTAEPTIVGLEIEYQTNKLGEAL